MTLESPDFGDGSAIPGRFTCDGENISPRLDVAWAPPGTESLAIVIRDPDAPLGVWHHWVEYDIPVDDIDAITIPENAGALGTQGLNSWKVPGYGGPCPPEGQSHRYVFSVYAVDSDLGLPGSLDADALVTALEGHTLGEAILVGSYAR
jgi:Raf kinase inhibitor-like YbhB/YbcL family protein